MDLFKKHNVEPIIHFLTVHIKFLHTMYTDLIHVCLGFS